MKKKLLKTTFTALCIVACITTKAQDAASTTSTSSATSHEFGLGMSGFSTGSFSLRYQWGTDQSFFRITALSLSANTINENNTSTSNDTSSVPSSSNTTTPINIGFGINVRWAKIKSINDRFGIEYGPAVGASFSYVETNSTQTNSFINDQQTNYSRSTETNIQPFIGLMLGLRYKISSAFYVYAEITPNLYYNYSKSTSVNSSNVNSSVYTINATSGTFGFSGLQNNGALIALAYRF